jgi:DNA-binding transcriptional MerR regulator/effector-binding domain-containing protein
MTAAITIGDFSKMTHLSVKTLHHYHEVGLLEPAEVDRHTGYRYYSPEQVPTAQVIRRLRDLEMPVTDVKAVLAATDAPTRNALIAKHLDRLETQLARTQGSVDSLRTLLERPETDQATEHRSVATAPAVGIQDVVDRADVLAWWQGALGELHASVRAQGLPMTGPAGGLFAGDLYQHDRGQATVFIPISGTVHAIGRVMPFVVPAAELAVAVHYGSLADVDITYGTLGSYVTTHEISVDGPLREYYLHDSYDTPNPDEWQTEIGWPIFRADATT